MFFEDEEWRYISDYPNYLISNYGRVYNHSRNKLMKTRVDDGGYERIGLSQNDHQKIFGVHQLVADAFLYRPLETTQVNHLDGDKLYNGDDNLEWSTCAENHKHAFRLGLKVAPNKRAVRIVETGDVFDSITECAHAIGGISQGVHNYLSGQSKRYLGFTYEYADLE